MEIPPRCILVLQRYRASLPTQLPEARLPPRPWRGAPLLLRSYRASLPSCRKRASHPDPGEEPPPPAELQGLPAQQPEACLPRPNHGRVHVGRLGHHAGGRVDGAVDKPSLRNGGKKLSLICEQRHSAIWEYSKAAASRLGTAPAADHIINRRLRPPDDAGHVALHTLQQRLLTILAHRHPALLQTLPLFHTPNFHTCSRRPSAGRPMYAGSHCSCRMMLQ